MFLHSCCFVCELTLFYLLHYLLSVVLLSLMFRCEHTNSQLQLSMTDTDIEPINNANDKQSYRLKGHFEVFLTLTERDTRSTRIV